MYQITAPTPYNGMGYGIRFVDGVGITDNGRTARMLQSKGYTVEELPAAELPPAFDPDNAKGDELKAFAAANGIDLGGATKVEDIRAAVKAWLDQHHLDGDGVDDPGDSQPKTLTPPDTAAVTMGGSGACIQTGNGGGQR